MMGSTQSRISNLQEKSFDLDVFMGKIYKKINPALPQAYEDHPYWPESQKSKKISMNSLLGILIGIYHRIVGRVPHVNFLHPDFLDYRSLSKMLNKHIQNPNKILYLRDCKSAIDQLIFSFLSNVNVIEFDSIEKKSEKNHLRGGLNSGVLVAHLSVNNLPKFLEIVHSFTDQKIILFINGFLNEHFTSQKVISTMLTSCYEIKDLACISTNIFLKKSINEIAASFQFNGSLKKLYKILNISILILIVSLRNLFSLMSKSKKYNEYCSSMTWVFSLRS